MSDPLSLVQFIISAIDEEVPNRGDEIYWRAFKRWQEYCAARAQAEAERELTKAAPLLALARDEWTKF